MNWGINNKLLHLLKWHNIFQSHGSLTIRFGAIIFGLVAFIYILLQLIEFYEMDPKAPHPCYDVSKGVNSYLMLVFVVLQIFVIFCYPRLNLLSYQLINRFIRFTGAQNIMISYGREKFYHIGSRGLYYKTYYDSNLRIFVEN
jgi:hypothetical protein